MCSLMLTVLPQWLRIMDDLQCIKDTSDMQPK